MYHASTRTICTVYITSEPEAPHTHTVDNYIPIITQVSLMCTLVSKPYSTFWIEIHKQVLY